jgi:hypothetical protein
MKELVDAIGGLSELLLLLGLHVNSSIQIGAVSLHEPLESAVVVVIASVEGFTQLNKSEVYSLVPSPN